MTATTTLMQRIHQQSRGVRSTLHMAGGGLGELVGDVDQRTLLRPLRQVWRWRTIALQIPLRDQDRKAEHRFAGCALHRITGLEEQCMAWFSEVLDTVDHFLCQPLHRQPQHPTTHLLSNEFHLAPALNQEHLELINTTTTHQGIEAS
jgi:hypothetical protein